MGGDEVEHKRDALVLIDKGSIEYELGGPLFRH